MLYDLIYLCSASGTGLQPPTPAGLDPTRQACQRAVRLSWGTSGIWLRLRQPRGCSELPRALDGQGDVRLPAGGRGRRPESATTGPKDLHAFLDRGQEVHLARSEQFVIGCCAINHNFLTICPSSVTDDWSPGRSRPVAMVPGSRLSGWPGSSPAGAAARAARATSRSEKSRTKHPFRMRPFDSVVRPPCWKPPFAPTGNTSA